MTVPRKLDPHELAYAKLKHLAEWPRDNSSKVMEILRELYREGVARKPDTMPLPTVPVYPPVPDGLLTLTMVDGRIRIDQADKVVAFSRELIDEIKQDANPDVELRQVGTDTWVTIRGINRTVAYKVSYYLPIQGFYVMEMVEG